MEFRFGSFIVEPARRRLLRDGAPLDIGARAFDLLVALLQRRDRPASRAELIDAVWPELVVEENNLSVQVSSLRKLLGPGHIATIAGRGYQFVEPVQARHDAAIFVDPRRGPAPSRPPAPELVGREDELAELNARPRRLLTLCGPGGVGKTALALHHALHAEREGGQVLWLQVDAHVGAVDLVAYLAELLGLRQPGAATPATIAAALHHRQALVVIDGAERHVDTAATLVEPLLAAAPGVRVLVTSQLPLRSPSETILRLGGLHLPADDGDPAACRASGAVQLFLRQVQATGAGPDPDPGALRWAAHICRRLDGSPLAIRLAASRVPALGLEELHRRLDTRFRLLDSSGSGHGSEGRHAGLQATFDWSYSLLEPHERQLFRALSCCSRGFSLTLATGLGAAYVADEWEALAALESLMERSFVVVARESPRRLRLLESARAYAELQVQAEGEAQAVRAAHAKAMLEVAVEAGTSYWTLPEDDWRARFVDDIDNLKLALDWAMANDPALAAELLAYAAPLFYLPFDPAHFLARCEQLQAGGGLGMLPLAASARFLAAHAWIAGIATLERDFELAMAAAERCRQAGDDEGRYVCLCVAAGSQYAPPGAARAAYEEALSLERADWPPKFRRKRHNADMMLHFHEGRGIEGRMAAEAALALSTACGATSLVRADMVNLAYFLLLEGQLAQAIALGQQLRQLQAGSVGVLRVTGLGNLLHALLLDGQMAEVRSCLSEFLEASRSAEWVSFGAFAFLLPLFAALGGRPRAAAVLLGHADASRNPYVPALAAQARERALAAAQARCDGDELAHLMLQGRDMARERIAALALGEADLPASRTETLS